VYLQDCCGSPLAVPVLTSTLQRTIQTAAHLRLPQQRLPALDEINAGICEHMSYQQVQQTYPAVAEARARDKLGYR
jgi:6-phosphofructo-2-kinase/fructose-2,6-biphosphatase 2